MVIVFFPSQLRGWNNTAMLQLGDMKKVKEEEDNGKMQLRVWEQKCSYQLGFSHFCCDRHMPCLPKPVRPLIS